MYGGKGLTLNHPSTHPPSLHPSPTAPVTIATEEEVGIFKGQAACSAGYPRGDYSALHTTLLMIREVFRFYCSEMHLWPILNCAQLWCTWQCLPFMITIGAIWWSQWFKVHILYLDSPKVSSLLVLISSSVSYFSLFFLLIFCDADHLIVKTLMLHRL